MYFQLAKHQKVEIKKHGGKVIGLHELMLLEMNVPKTIVLPKDYTPDEESLKSVVSFFGETNSVIVRSSSPYEDIENSSMAGVFHSEITVVSNLIHVIRKIRASAKSISLKLNLPQDEIPVIIQPVVEGSYGGVYLSDDNSNDRLVISSLGVSSVTSGINGAIDTLSENDPIYNQTMTQLRELRDKINYGIDVEFIISSDGKLNFLQKRRNNSVIAPEITLDGFKLSDHFPFILSNLEGSIWHNIFEEVFPQKTLFKNNRIYDRQNENINISQNFGKLELLAAYDYYYDILFPKWENTFTQFLYQVKQDSDPVEMWRKVYSQWKQFYHEYFCNPHYATISSTKNQLTSGVSIAPCIVNWINNLYNLCDKIGTDEYETTVKSFIDTFFYYFFTNNCFSQPSLEESPEVVEIMIKNIPSAKRRVDVKTEPSLELKVSWLCEEDNRYKNMFNYLLRKAIVKLSIHLVSISRISETSVIWNIQIAELDKIINGTSKYSQNILQDRSSSQIKKDTDTIRNSYTAEVLSGGNAEGNVSKELNSFQESNILVRVSLEVWNYPLFLNSAGAIVSIGSKNYHSAIFARDVSIPLYKSAAAVQGLISGDKVKLDEQSSSINVVNE